MAVPRTLVASGLMKANPIEPDELMASFVFRNLCRAECDHAQGWVVVSGIKDYFQRVGLTLFSEVDDRIADDTLYLCNLLRRVQELIAPNKGVSDFCLVYDRLANTLGKLPAFVNAKMDPIRHLRRCRLGVERIVNSLIEMAKSRGRIISRESFFDIAAITCDNCSSRPHFGSFEGICALQRSTAGIEGGDILVYDVGRFLNENSLNPWDVLVAESTDKKQIEPRIDFMPYNRLVLRAEFLSLIGEYSSQVKLSDNDALIWNNLISFEGGSYHAIAIGAMPQSRRPHQKPHERVVLSIAMKNAAPLLLRSILENGKH